MAPLVNILALITALLAPVLPLDDSRALLYEEKWSLWKGEHKVAYENEEEEQKRYSIWLENMKYIDNYNSKNLSYTLRMNQFGDLSEVEYSSIYTCHIVSNQDSDEVIGKKYNPPRDAELPYSINWRKKAAVTGIKSQGEYRCHSCYAFSSIAALESHHAISSGSKIRLSEQNVIDCSSGYGNAGCNGGNYRNTFKYIMENGGVDTQKYYPYKALKKSCRYSSEKIGASMSGVYYIESGSESDLKSAVGLEGPVVVSIDHRHKSFQFYGGGIYSESDCYTNYYLMTHEMLAVGYGTYQDTDYWILKNSYGSSWGRWGYMLMVRGQNSCGIATDAAFPVV